jgi:peptide/nickel transport system ATP-binding protein
MTGESLLQVEDLKVAFETRTGLIEAVRGVSFELGREKLGIVGESGSGKSMSGRALLGLVPPPGRVTAKVLRFGELDLLTAGPRQLRDLRGRRISMVMQDPKFSLNPVMTVGRQITEAYCRHFAVNAAEARRRALAMIEAVRIRDPERVLIAMMLIPDPDLLIADEPTSALDVTVRLQVLAILDDLVMQRGMGLIFISHDLNLVASFCDRVLVMYAGRILESCRADRLQEARHPYTQGLLSCLPTVEHEGSDLPTLRRDPAWLSEPLARE